MKDISFNLEAVTLDKANQRVIKPDKDGIYHGLVLMVMGKPSRNGKIYEVESMLDAITNPSSCFYKTLVAGQAYGEAGHPLIYSENEISRIATIDMARVSHVILKVYTGKTTEQGHTLVYGDVKPIGPYKDMLIESLESSVLNTAFSLRSLVEKIGTDNEGNIIQKVQALISFDMVSAPGYAAASKVHSASDESLFIPVTNKSTGALKSLVSQEVISDHQLEDMLGLDKINVLRTQYGVSNEGLHSNGKNVDIFHTMFGR